MRRLTSDPAIARLARALGLSTSGDCVARLCEHALGRVRAFYADWQVASLRELQLVVANGLSVCLEYLNSDEDVEATARAHAAFSPHLTHALSAEFLFGDTEGLLIPHPYPQAGDLRYLAVVDQRGPRLARGYFTAWHELAHLLVSPPQLAFDGFRRSPPLEFKQKDPVESLIDKIAGLVGFYEPIFSPVVKELRRRAGGRLTLSGIESARASAVPEASFYATALAAVRVSPDPVGLICARPFWKRGERLSQAGASQLPSLRLISATYSPTAHKAGLHMHPNMRVPKRSILYRVYHQALVEECAAEEDQSWWETSAAGPLTGLTLHVSAVLRGPVAYAVVMPVS
jgi:hypothetical protein